MIDDITLKKYNTYDVNIFQIPITTFEISFQDMFELLIVCSYGALARVFSSSSSSASKPVGFLAMILTGTDCLG